MFAKQTCLCLTHSVYTKREYYFVFSKMKHNRLSPRPCTKFGEGAKNGLPLLVFVCSIGTCELWIIDIKNNLSNLLPEITQTTNIVSYVV